MASLNTEVGTPTSDMLQWLFEAGRIDLERGGIFDLSPAPLPSVLPWDRVEGMLLGLAIGDSLGNTTESMSPPERRARFGMVRDYFPDLFLGGDPIGLPSDDTQLAFRTLEQILDDGGLIPDHLARRFREERITGVGLSVASFVRAYGVLGNPWYEAGVRSAGNGALMRIAPVLVPHLRSPSPRLWADTALAAMLTHNDRASTGSCLAFVRMLWDLLAMDRSPEPGWWLDAFCSTLQPLEGETSYRVKREGITYTGPLWRFVQEYVRSALDRRMSVVDACNWWGSGAYLLETVPSALHILATCAHDPEEAILRSVNDTWDNDTIGAIVGAAIGALHGSSAFPRRWIAHLPGRLGPGDDGRIFELIDQAKRAVRE